jgi:hypothetical protein
MLITRAFYTYLSKFPVKEPPSQFPTGALWREMPITRAFYTYNLGSPVKEAPSRFPSQSPHREGHTISKARLHLSLKGPGKKPPMWFPNVAPWNEMPIPTAFLHFIPSFTGKEIRSPSAEPHADGRPTYSGVWPGSPRGSFWTLLLTTPVPCSLQHNTFHLGLGRPQPH